MYNFISQVVTNLDSRKHTIGLFFDLSRAFDLVNHKLLLGKLENAGIRGVALDWFCSVLVDRHQIVKTPYLDNFGFMRSRVEDEFLNSSSKDSLSEDDEDGWMLTEEVEKEFYKTLSQIKNKDPKIYNKDVEFFKDVTGEEKKRRNKNKSTPLTLRDYERKLVLEKEGKLSDEELPQCSNKKQEFNSSTEPTYVEEQESLKKSFKDVLNNASEDEGDESWGGLFKKREKTIEEKDAEEKHYKDWLKGQKESLSDEEVEKDMRPLRSYWTDPNLNEEDQFLRDYVLNKKFLEHDDKTEDTVSNVLLENNEEVKVQDENEHNYRHRFEEPDQEFIKRYPRVMENSIRRKKDHRKQKRDEIKERKIKDKERKRAEIKHKKKLKKMEIEEKIEELKKLTGNDQLAFENVLNQDFDLDEHDKAMKQLFNDEFYSQNDPNFHPTDSAGAENGELWNEEETAYEEGTEDVEDTLNCEDPNFNMDCDYDPTQDKQKPKESRSRRRKDKHKRTTVSEAVNKEKPKFDPSVHQSFKDYLDQYYAIDCEDFIGDMPCRYKYRQVVPNSYGLTIDEILAADDKELDRWCSIKRIRQIRPEVKEKCDVKVFQKKAQNEELKRKILPSLFKKNKDQEKSDNKEENSIIIPKEDPNIISNKLNDSAEETSGVLGKCENTISVKNSKHKKKKKNKQNLEGISNLAKMDTPNTNNRKRKNNEIVGNNTDSKKKRVNKNVQKSQWFVKSKKHDNNRKSTQETNLSEMSDARLLAYGIKPKKFRNKLKYGINS